MIKLHLLKLHDYPIYRQLQLEEALFRTERRNFCIVNRGSPPACVLGIGAKPQDAVKIDCPLPLIKRFSGGGDVIVDQNTLFISFLIQKKELPVPPFPKKILAWTQNIYAPLFAKLNFNILDNDYVLEEKKIGGNAQSIGKKSWLHHTSFLWDFDEKRMDFLKMPLKTPAYRRARPHKDFMGRLKEYFASQKEFLERFFSSLDANFTVTEISEEEALKSLALPHRKATTHIKKPPKG